MPTKSSAVRSKAKPKKTKKASSPKRSALLPDVTSKAVNFLDQAATLLRKGITTSKSQSVQVRNHAKKKAHLLIDKAHSLLGGGLKKGSCMLHKMFNKI